jgi:hypothetical protein
MLLVDSVPIGDCTFWEPRVNADLSWCLSFCDAGIP